MTEKPEWFIWLAAYLKRFLGPGENTDFVDTWKPEILKRELADTLAAIGDVAVDPQSEARFPRQHLRLLLEQADARADRRRPGWKDPLAERPTPSRGTRRWNRWMLEHGVIDKVEFNRREREKE